MAAHPSLPAGVSVRQGDDAEEAPTSPSCSWLSAKEASRRGCLRPTRPLTLPLPSPSDLEADPSPPQAD